jgi:hypothetical protein
LKKEENAEDADNRNTDSKKHSSHRHKTKRNSSKSDTSSKNNSQVSQNSKVKTVNNIARKSITKKKDEYSSSEDDESPSKYVRDVKKNNVSVGKSKEISRGKVRTINMAENDKQEKPKKRRKDEDNDDEETLV